MKLMMGPWSVFRSYPSVSLERRVYWAYVMQFSLNKTLEEMLWRREQVAILVTQDKQFIVPLSLIIDEVMDKLNGEIT